MWRLSLAGLRAHARRMVATGFAIVLGVGFVTGTLLFNNTAKAAFFDTYARMAKGVDVAVEPPNAGQKSDPASLAPDQLAAVRSLSTVDQAVGRVVATLPMLDARGRLVANFGRTGFGVSTDGDPRLRPFDVVGQVPAGPGQALLDTETAAHQHLVIGGAITVLDQAGTRHRYQIVGVMDFGASKRFSGSSVVGLPTAELDPLTGATGFDEIVASARPGVSQEDLATAVRAAVSSGATVVTGDQRRTDLANSATQVAAQFTTIIAIFGAISLVVAAFVIYNTFAILLAQRIREIALLRCVGATRRQVFQTALGESIVVGAAGAGAGVLVGVGVVWALYLLLNGVLHAGIPAHGIVVSGGPVVAGLAIGIAVTVGAALLPALRATRTSPMAALRDQPGTRASRRAARVMRLLVASLVGAGGLALTVGGTRLSDPRTGTFQIVAGGVVTFLAVLIAAPLYIGRLTAVVGAVPARLFGVPVRIEVANARRNPGRTAVTSATLMIGVGLMALFSVLIATLTETADRQLTGHYPVDYVMTGAAPAESAAAPGISPAYAATIRQRPEFSGVAETRVVTATVGADAGHIAAIDPAALGGLIQPEMVSGTSNDLRTGTAIVSASHAITAGLRVGDQITVAVGVNTAVLRVVGTAQTTIPRAGTVEALVSWDQLLALAGPGDDTTVMAKAAPGITPTASADILDGLSDRFPLVQVNSIADLSNDLRTSVNGLIALFAALLGTAIVIALFGIANTLALSVVERTRESAMVRALGLTRTQLRVTLLVEAILMGVVGALAGVVYGLAYGQLVLAKAFAAIGPTIVVPWSWLVGLVALAAGAAMLAAVLPARRATRASIVAGMAET
jgi:putative ABC transport system permease protein